MTTQWANYVRRAWEVRRTWTRQECMWVTIPSLWGLTLSLACRPGQAVRFILTNQAGVQRSACR